jgi:hypothetical protein
LVFTHFAVFIKNGHGEFDFGYRWGPGVSVSVVGERLDTYSIYAALS